MPGLHREERLPWLDAVEDEEDEFDEPGIDPARVWAFVLGGLALLILIVVGVWWNAHRHDTAGQLADGSLITAPPGPFKEVPQDPGGKTFDGTGDLSFAVSQGHSPGARLAGTADQAEEGGAGDPAVTNAAAGSVGVQVGAFSTQATAEADWQRLVKAFDALSGVSHRIVEGQADIGTVYRLQAVAGSAGAATALCERLKSAGLNCQVKD